VEIGTNLIFSKKPKFCSVNNLAGDFFNIWTNLNQNLNEWFLSF